MNFINYSRIMNFNDNDKLWKRKKWINNDTERNAISENIHWGQLKLFYSELEFLTICLENGYKLEESVVIYIGAAPGIHTKYLTKLFPNLHCILIDPAKFYIEENNFISIYTGKKGFFTDDSIPELLAHNFLKICNKIIFISDIRSNTNEDSIFKEMLDQQRWLLKLNADISMLKFRLPYTLDNGNDNWTYDLNYIKQYIKNTVGRPCINKKNNLCYLKGDIYLQIFPPQYSTETRLIVDKHKDKYKLFNYDTIKYEEKCYYYNTEIRKNQMYYLESKELKNHLIGFKDNYETCSIYYIIQKFCKITKQDQSLSNIINIIYDIHNFHNTIETFVGNEKIKKSLGISHMFTIYEKFSNYNKFKNKLLDNTNNDLQNRKEILMNSINKIYKNVMAYNDYQINKFENGLILSEDKYKKQIEILIDADRFNKIIYNFLLNLAKIFDNENST